MRTIDFNLSFKRLVVGCLLYMIFSLHLKAEGLDVDITKIPVGEPVIFNIDGIPVLVHKRTQMQLEAGQLVDGEDNWFQAISMFAIAFNVKQANFMLAESEIYTHHFRSKRPDIAVFYAIAAPRFCMVVYDTEQNRYSDPCTGTSFDTRGLPENGGYPLLIPPHYYEGDRLFFKSIDTAEITEHFTADSILMAPEPRIDRLLAAAFLDDYAAFESILSEELSFLEDNTELAVKVFVIAMSRKQYELVELLLDTGVDANSSTAEGVKLLDFAFMLLDLQLVALLSRYDGQLSANFQCNNGYKKLFEFIKEFHGDLITAQEIQAFLDTAEDVVSLSDQSC